jgi:hypothetical protein
MYCILGDSLDGECVVDLQEMLKMAMASSEAFPQNRLCCTILMSASLSSKLPSPTFVSGPILMLALDGAKKSLMHFRETIGTGTTCGVDP